MLAAVFLALSAWGSCARPGSVNQTPAQEALLDSLRAAIVQLVEVPVCSLEDECRTVPFGAKPCGGPWGYLVYSTGVSDSAELSRLVADYTSMQDKINRQNGTASDCRLVPKPEIECSASRCTVISSN